MSYSPQKPVSYALKAKNATNADFAVTASFALNGGGTINTGSLLTTASFSNPNITFTKGNGSTFTTNLITLVPTNASTASYVDGGKF